MRLGENSDEDATYGKSWGLDQYCGSWDKQLIIVGVECAHEGNLRLSGYLPYGSGYGWLKGIESLGEATIQGLISKLNPYIDQSFPTIPFWECTAIGGSSMGGLMAVYALVRYNRFISKAACLSPAIICVSGKLWHDMNNTKLSPGSRIYLSWGTQEGYGGIKDPRTENKSSWLNKTCKTTADKVQAAGGVSKLCIARWEDATVKLIGRNQSSFSLRFCGRTKTEACCFNNLICMILLTLIN